jgi:nucleoside-diphosphate-sugar epimerase
MDTILVTGGAGFIGSNIADALASRGFRVVVLDDLSTGRLDNLDPLLHAQNFTFVRGSVLDRGLLRSIMKTYQVSGISHQAAIASVTKSVIDPVRSIEANITGTANLFDIAAESCCRRVVFASSCAVYGNGQESPKKETLPLDPRSPYAVTKAAKEMLARTFCDLHSMEIVGLRYFNVYGRRQSPGSDYAAVIPAFITRALRNEPLPIEGDGLQTRDFVYIDDVVQANLRGLTAKNVAGRCFNIGSGTNVSILELARLIIAAAGSGSAIMHRPGRAGDVRDSLADIGRSRNELGYAPEFSMSRGLAEAIAWYRANQKIKPARPVDSAGEITSAA